VDLHFDVVGAQGPKRYFDALTREKISHAYLFSGPSGVGKKTFARRLAQSLLCLAPKEAVLGYDGTCSSCRLFAAENARHPDFLEHAGALKIGERDVAMGFYEGEELHARDLVRQLSMQSYGGGMRVLLLGDVEFASPPAANALLKFLEESPRGVVMLLTTPVPESLLPTIRSRVIELRFPRLSTAEVAEILTRMQYTTAEAKLGASLGGGSVTRAVAALGGEDESLRATVIGWFFETLQGKAPPSAWASRETLDEGIETVKTLVRDWIVANAGDGVALVSLDQEQRLRALRPIGGKQAAALLIRLDEAQNLAQTNVPPAMVGELLRMAHTNTVSP
jgi:DNA polymerase III subunit delta'